MEDLIRQAFLHVDVIGPHVQEGHYDLVGPNGEIILPQVWETMIEPDWAITMHMWPMPEPKAADGPPTEPLPPIRAGAAGRRGTQRSGRHKEKVPPAPPAAPGWIGPGPGEPSLPPGISLVLDDDVPKPKKKSAPSSSSWLFGGPSKSKPKKR
jgi:hypothetical protein